MTREPIISVSGLRGVVGETLTTHVAARYACSFAAEVREGPLVISRDGRATGRMLADAIRASLCGIGRDIIDVDVAATPTTGVLVDHLQAAGGIQISASHNPAEYNGLKLFGDEARVISAAQGQRVLDHYRAHPRRPWVTHDRVGTVYGCEDTLGEHCRRVLDGVDADRIRAAEFKVLLDSNHGAGSLLGRRILSELGCQIVMVGADADGKFEHMPEPTADNLREICREVRDAKVHVGFCQDPDADRLALIDGDGRYIGEEYTLAIVVDHILRQREGPIVTNCSTSRMSQDLAAKYGVPFLRSKVGEANVTEMMIEHNAVFGGEGNGGPIDPRVVYVRDSFVGMAFVLDAMAERGASLAECVEELPKYVIHKSKAPLSGHSVEKRFDRLQDAFSDAEFDRMDGLRLDWSDRWLLVRASNTEPIVRLVAEAETRQTAKELCDRAAKLLTRDS